jgi:thiol-disulfide isomerase/thioredoxin
MNRRTLLLTTAALVALPLTAMANTMIPYTPGPAEAAIANGDTVLLGFSADWCPTCRSQERTITALRDGNPAYDAAISFYRVDWDVYGSGALSQSLFIPLHSTLVLFRGGAEVVRTTGSTREADIRALLDAGL